MPLPTRKREGKVSKINKILSWPFVFLIRLYQKYISPHKTPCCRFTPTCSVYAVTALVEWGPLFGLALAIWRVLRCNPFGKGGYDPVPTPWWRRKKDGGNEAAEAAEGEDSPNE